MKKMISIALIASTVGSTAFSSMGTQENPPQMSCLEKIEAKKRAFSEGDLPAAILIGAGFFPLVVVFQPVIGGMFASVGVYAIIDTQTRGRKVAKLIRQAMHYETTGEAGSLLRKLRKRIQIDGQHPSMPSLVTSILEANASGILCTEDTRFAHLDDRFEDGIVPIEL